MIRPVNAVVAILALSLATPAVAQSAGIFAPLDSIAPPPAAAVLVTLHASKRPLRDVIADLARQAGVTIAFDPALATLDRRVSLDAAQISVSKALLQGTLDGTGLQGSRVRRRIDCRYRARHRKTRRTQPGWRFGAAIRRPTARGRTPLTSRNALRGDERRGRADSRSATFPRAHTHSARCAWALPRARRRCASAQAP